MTIQMKPGWDELLPSELNEAELGACVVEAERRGLGLTRLSVEQAYEALLTGQREVALRGLSVALFPNGVDDVRARVAAKRREDCMGNRKPYVRWTTTMDRRLAQLWPDTSVSVNEIARRFGADDETVRTHARRLQLPDRRSLHAKTGKAA